MGTDLALEEFLPHTGLTRILPVQILPLSPVIVRIIKKLEKGTMTEVALGFVAYEE